jgi:branched-chain amino acid transport system substrate-binding protein
MRNARRALAKGTASTLVKMKLDSWYFVTIDFAGGHSIEKDATDVVQAGGGKVLVARFNQLERI